MMRMALILALLLPFTALAKELRAPGSTVRALGMGNAFSAVVKDSDSLFYNPAALGRVRGLNWTTLSTDLGVNGLNIMNIIDEVSSIESIEDYSRLYGEYIWLGANAQTAVSFPGFGIAYYSHNFLDFEMQSPTLPYLDGGLIHDQGIIVGGAFEVWEGGYLGISVKRVLRQGGSRTVGIGTIAEGDLESIMDEFTAKGVGIGMDLGFLMEFDGKFNPVFSAVLKDVGNTKFIAEAGRGKPPSEMQNLTVGVGGSVELPLMTVSAGVDVRHVLNDEEQFGKKLHLGTEIQMPLLDLRAGFHQGYYTLGMGFDFYFVRFDLASYGVERGVYPGQVEDRRYQAEMRIEFGIDPDFKLMGIGAGSGGGKVKQRR